MIKIVFVCSFLLALSYSASSETIRCYFCISSDAASSEIHKTGLTLESVEIPSDLCSEPIENSKTKAVDNEIYSCASLDVTFAVPNGTVDVIFRMAIEKDTCREIEEEYQDEMDLIGIESSLVCSDCKEEFCNGL